MELSLQKIEALIPLNAGDTEKKGQDGHFR